MNFESTDAPEVPEIIYPEGWVDPDAVPDTLSPAQLRRALNHFQLRAAVEAAVAASDQDTKDWYEFGTYFLRHHPAIKAMTEALSIPETVLDEVWRYGATLL